jgi:hypothetical protein
MPFQTPNQLFFIVPAQAVVARWLSSFKEFPPPDPGERQR